MRKVFIAFCLALSGVCISALPDAAISAAKPSSTENTNVSVAALQSQPAHVRPSAPADAKSGAATSSEPGDVLGGSKADDKPDQSDSASQPSPPVKPDSAASRPDPSREEFCTLLMSAAEEHTLPIGFFVNLIWQESRFIRTAVSSAGALGVAQFMPATAEGMGLRNPFDPRQALPASARLLRELHEQFGNLGLAAAAYNAGPKRILDWLAKRGRLPHETRNYVLTITGRPAEHWTTNPPPPIAFRVPPRVPCFEVEAFAAAVKPADSPPPRESAPVVKSVEVKAVKLSRSTAKRSKQSAPVRTAFKKARTKAVVAKRMELAKSAKVAAKPKEAAKLAKAAAKASKNAAKASKDAAKPKDAGKPTKEASLRGLSKTSQR